MKYIRSGYQPIKTFDCEKMSTPKGGSDIQKEEEHNDWLRDENNRLISEIQKLKSDNTMLKETIVKLTMKLTGETE